MYRIRNSGWLEVISGSMFSGKTTELIHRLEKVDLANQKYKVFKPQIDTRYSSDKITSHGGLSVDAIPVEKANDILEHVYEEVDVVAIDEIQFFDEEIYDVINLLLKDHTRVIIVGLDMDFRGEPFPKISKLMAKAEFITKLHGVCAICGELGTKTQRYVDGKPAHYNDPTIIVGGKEQYKCVCKSCHTVLRD